MERDSEKKLKKNIVRKKWRKWKKSTDSERIVKNIEIEEKKDSEKT